MQKYCKLYSNLNYNISFILMIHFVRHAESIYNRAEEVIKK